MELPCEGYCNTAHRLTPHMRRLPKGLVTQQFFIYSFPSRNTRVYASLKETRVAGCTIMMGENVNYNARLLIDPYKEA